MSLSQKNNNNNSLCDLFEQLNDTKVYGIGQDIYQEEEEVEGIFLVKKGRVKIWKFGIDANRKLIFYFANPSEPFGVLDILNKRKKRNCTATAMGDEVEIQFIPYFEVYHTILKNFELRLDIFRLLIKSEQTNHEKYKGMFLSRNMDERVFWVLRHLAKWEGLPSQEGLILAYITHQELSEYIGCSRQSVTQAINNLKKIDLISYDRKKIVIKRGFEVY